MILWIKNGGYWPPLVGVLLAVFLLSACQTSMLRQFEAIKPGMEKGDVLALMGSPSQVIRFHGKDRWFFIFYDHQIRFQKEVQFFEGNAVYVGDMWQPEASSSAIAQDQRNNLNNNKVDEMIKQETENNRRLFENYEVKVKGADKVRYLPEFEPIK